MNPIGIRYTASGSAEFYDMQMYLFNFYNKDLWQGPAPIFPSEIVETRQICLISYS